ncbi:hypothetical protein DMN77_21380, partial [Paenibacillus sp. 79R4]|uniref:hypothetical protein n=1 Tax=Paenibacillus sp. 79R4 TaxID=2212847 RepID=UPI001C4D1DD1
QGQGFTGTGTPFFTKDRDSRELGLRFSPRTGIHGNWDSVFHQGQGLMGTEDSVFHQGQGFMGTEDSAFHQGQGFMGTEDSVFVP